MPITRSAIKALRQSARRRARNVVKKTALKATIKQYKKLAAADKNEARKFLSQVYKRLDKSAKTHIIKKNKAARLKSKLTKLL